MKRLEHGDVIALLGEVARTGSGRSGGADNGDRNGLGGLLHVGVVPVGDKAFETANADRLANDAAHCLLSHCVSCGRTRPQTAEGRRSWMT